MEWGDVQISTSSPGLEKRSSLFKYSVVINRFDDFSLRIKARLIYLQHRPQGPLVLKVLNSFMSAVCFAKYLDSSCNSQAVLTM